ncbi:MAG: hypothetical protein HGA36_05155 [Candidatus Moranbacteria bacterium]|nr:hypothetical protein [Candidatus Moranbacteria bacterium]
MFKIKTAKIIGMLLLVIGSGLLVFNFVRAEDDDDDEDDDDRIEQSEERDDSSSKVKTKTITQTIVVTPARIVTENEMREVFLPDRDRDGIPDMEDAYPDTAEIYIVKDDNKNGIVDTFEYDN